jgi:hypothetical protein
MTTDDPHAELAALDGARIDRLPSLLSELLSHPDARRTCDALHELLESKRLDHLEADGTPCRVRLARSLLHLGYPYALEISPEDLGLARSTGGLGTWANGAFVLAALSLLWNGFFALMLSSKSGELKMAIPFWIGAFHAIGAIACSCSRQERWTRSIWKLLFSMILFGPAASLAIGLTERRHLGEIFLVGMLVALPAMLTAAACGMAAKSCTRHFAAVSGEDANLPSSRRRLPSDPDAGAGRSVGPDAARRSAGNPRAQLSL